MISRWVQSVWDRFLASDPGAGRARAGWRMLISLVASFAASSYVARGFGQPVELGLSFGGVIGLITGLTVPEAPILRMGRLIAWHVVPYAAGLGLGLVLAGNRTIALAAIAVVIFLQFYLERFGPYGRYFGITLFACYLVGLQPGNALAQYPRYLVFGVAGAAACFVTRALLCPHNPVRDVRQTRRAYDAASRRAVALLTALLETGSTLRAGRRLDRALERVNTVALGFDGRLAQARIDTRRAEHLHRRIFDHEHALTALTRAVGALAKESPSSQAKQRVVEQLRSVAFDHDGDSRGLRHAAQGQADAAHLTREQASLMKVADALDAYQLSLRALDRETALGAEEGMSFTGVVALEGANPAGAKPLAHRAAAAQSPHRRRSKPGLSTRGGIQAAVAVAIAVPVGDAINGARYYWAVIGALIVLAGASTPHERGRRVIRRIVGTILGGVLGLGIYHLVGPEHPWWTLLVIVGALTIGAYTISASYPVFVTCLVIALAQLYATAGGSLDTTLLYRLVENATGAVIAAIVATVILPVSTYSVIRAGLDGYLQALKSFTANLSAHLTDPDIRIRSDVRALDHALFQVKAAVSQLFPTSLLNGGRGTYRYRSYRRARAMTDLLASAVDDARSLAHNTSAACLHANSSGTTTLRQSIDDLTKSIGEVQQQLNKRHHNKPTALTKGLAPNIHNDNDTQLRSTLVSLNSLASQVVVLAQRGPPPATFMGPL